MSRFHLQSISVMITFFLIEHLELRNIGIECRVTNQRGKYLETAIGITHLGRREKSFLVFGIKGNVFITNIPELLSQSINAIFFIFMLKSCLIKWTTTQESVMKPNVSIVVLIKCPMGAAEKISAPAHVARKNATAPGNL